MASQQSFMQRLPKPSKEVKASLKTGCIFPIAQIAIGAVYLNDCPRQEYIPIYLIVAGVFGLVLGLFSCLPCTQKPADSPHNPASRACSVWSSLTSTFLFCWFICGNVWIYSIYPPNYNQTLTQTDGPYCHRTLYLFAFWSTTLTYILLGVFLLVACCALVCCCILGINDPDDNAV
ncbi:transmembrane protein 272-like [Osmerus eperlanus]|uniref:transmembrane protein 272-like n=1 Tax=Osmerus eperlanus TaxID=29151 RepID=UPI002E1564D2